MSTKQKNQRVPEIVHDFHGWWASAECGKPDAEIKLREELNTKLLEKGFVITTIHKNGVVA